MPAYRGVDQREIVDSIRHGFQFLQTLRIGSVTDTILTNEALVPGLEEIEGAPNNEALVAAMRSTGFRDFFCPFHEILRFHALTDSPIKGMAGPALGAYKSLMSWSAFTLTAQLVPPDVDPEITNYFILECLGRIAQMDQMLHYDRLQGALKELPRDVADYMDMAVDVFVLLFQTDRDELVRVLSDCPEKFASYLPLTLIAVTGLDEAEERWAIPTAICRHTIKLLSSTKTRSAELAKLSRQELNVLTEFFDSDEICPSIGIEPADDGRSQEVVLYSTERAAEALRNAVSGGNALDSQEQNAGIGD